MDINRVRNFFSVIEMEVIGRMTMKDANSKNRSLCYGPQLKGRSSFGEETLSGVIPDLYKGASWYFNKGAYSKNHGLANFLESV